MSQATASRSTSVASRFAVQLAIVLAIVFIVAAAGLVVGSTSTGEASADRAGMSQLAQDAWAARYEGIAVGHESSLTRGQAAAGARWKAIANAHQRQDRN